MRVKLINEEFNENLNNRESKEFQDLAEKIVSQVKGNEIFQIRINSSVCCIFLATIVYFTSKITLCVRPISIQSSTVLQ